MALLTASGLVNLSFTISKWSLLLGLPVLITQGVRLNKTIDQLAIVLQEPSTAPVSSPNRDTQNNFEITTIHTSYVKQNERAQQLKAEYSFLDFLALKDLSEDLSVPKGTPLTITGEQFVALDFKRIFEPDKNYVLKHGHMYSSMPPSVTTDMMTPFFPGYNPDFAGYYFENDKIKFDVIARDVAGIPVAAVAPPFIAYNRSYDCSIGWDDHGFEVLDKNKNVILSIDVTQDTIYLSGYYLNTEGSLSVFGRYDDQSFQSPVTPTQIRDAFEQTGGYHLFSYPTRFSMHRIEQD